MLNPSFAQFLVASVIASIIGISSYFLGSAVISAPVSVELNPAGGTLVVGETFITTLFIDSSVPVNVFKGLVVFDSEKLSVESINYNTSIANLWAEEPWYSNGDGTINFTGGTTAPGGFLGEGTLITITFATKSAGEAIVKMEDMRVLQHDGLGTEVAVATPIDAIFAVEAERLSNETVFNAKVEGPTITVLPEKPNKDLNNDGKQDVADVSIFMTDLLSKNLRSDLNGDGVVNLKDLSILTQS